MNCEQTRVAILEGRDRNEVEAHLSACAGCRSEQSSLVRIRETLGEASLWEEPLPELAERIGLLGRVATGEPRRQPGFRYLIPAAVLSAVLVAGILLSSDRSDWEIGLKGVGDGADASAVVQGWNEEEGTRLRIEVEGIEPSPPGHYYEIWLTSPDGLHVSAGTFLGDGVIDASVGVSRRDFPRLWITRESVNDGDSGPSSDTYFDSA